MGIRLFSYVLSVDDGAAPNPFWGFCTLAICKPVIRRVARVGDWVVGIGPAGKPTRGKLIYAMRVDEILPLDEYFIDPRFRMKKPQNSARDVRRHVGDNVYFKVRGRWKKLPGGTHTHANMAKDLRGRDVLISHHFYYFGRKAVDLPLRLQAIARGGQGHRSWFPQTYPEMLAEWLEKNYRPGIHGEPDGMAGCSGPCDAAVKCD